MKRLWFPLLLFLGLLAAAAPPPQSAGFARSVALAEKALETGELEAARRHVVRALERDPKSTLVWDLRARWAEAAGDRDELVYSLHRRLALLRAQGGAKEEVAALRARVQGVDPAAERLLTLSEKYLKKLLPLAERYEEEERPHSAIRVHKEILALDPENQASQAAIERIASAPDPSLAEDAKPKDLLADVSEEWIREFDAKTRDWKTKGVLERENYRTFTNAGYEVLVRAAEAMDQMNAFYRVFFQYGTEEHGGSVPRIDLNIFRTREEYLQLGMGPPVEWSGGHFTGSAVETYIGAGGFEETVGTLFHEAAHQFVSLATNAAGWLNEGLASFFEGCRILPNGTVLMNLPANHRLFPLVERMERGWMSDAWDGISRDDPSGSEPSKAPTFRIVLENQYPWGPPWYAPTWGVVYFLYNYQDPIDGRFVYRRSFGEFVDASGGRIGEGAVENFEEVVLGKPAPPTKGVDVSEGGLVLPRTVAELDPVWKEWLTRLRDEQTGRLEVARPYHAWATFAIQRKDLTDAAEHFEKGILATPDDPEILISFADLLIDELANPDRATKLLLRAGSLLETAQTVDEERVAYVDKRLAKIDPSKRTLERIHEELVAEITDIVRGYLGEGLDLMAMDVAWRMGNDFAVTSMFDYFEEAARRSKKSLGIWKLAYNEEDLEGWAASAAEIFTPEGEVIVARYGEFVPDNFEYRFLTLEEITSGDFSMEAEILVESGQVSFGGIVFGRKSDTDFHAVLLHPPSEGGAGLARKARVDLASFYGDGSYKTWRQSQVETSEDERSSSGWHRLRVDVTGTVVDTWFDEEYLSTHEFPNLNLLQGRFGLIVGKGTMRFRNVRYLARNPRDPGSWIERELKMEGLAPAGEGRGGSWLGSPPPFPRVTRWIQGERAAWAEAGIAPQLLVLWSIDQNELIPIDRWLTALHERFRPYGLRIVSIAQTWDEAKVAGYLAEHPFPDSVGVDQLDPGTNAGWTFGQLAAERFGLPRLLLLDIDGKVAWEGDPGFKAGAPYDPEIESYLDAPLEDLLERRRLLDLVAWRERWSGVGLPALAAGDLERAGPILLESRGFDWRYDDAVLEAQRRLGALDAAIAGLEDTLAALEQAGCEPALEPLLEWAALLGLGGDLASDRAVKAARKADGCAQWKRALGMLAPIQRRLDAGKELGSAADVVERLRSCEGTFPERLREALAGAEGDPAALARVIAEAPELPRRWLAAEHFGW